MCAGDGVEDADAVISDRVLGSGGNATMTPDNDDIRVLSGVIAV